MQKPPLSKRQLSKLFLSTIVASSGLAPGMAVYADTTNGATTNDSSATPSQNTPQQTSVSVTDSVYGTPASVVMQPPTMVAPGGQTTVTGVVYNADNVPVSGATVTLTGSAGSFANSTVTTDVYGTFSSNWTAPQTTGLVTVTGTVYGSSASPEPSGSTTVQVAYPAGSPQQAVTFADPALEQAVRQALNKPTGTITLADMESLTSLSAENAGITDLTGLQVATNLQSLNLAGNLISDVSPLSGLTNLTGLILDSNYIQDLSPLGSLTNLQELSISDNDLTDLAILDELSNLKAVNVAYNNLDLTNSTISSEIQQLTDKGVAVQSTPQSSASTAAPESVQLNVGDGSGVVQAGFATTVSGVVYDSNQNPVPNTTVTLSSSDGKLADTTVTTDTYGTYQTTFTAPAVNEDVTVTAAVYGVASASTSQDVQVQGGADASMTVTGKVTDASGQAVGAGIDVSFVPSDGTQYDATTQADGTYSINLPVGSYSVTAANGYWVGTATVSGSNGQTVKQDIQLKSEDAIVEGKVTDLSGNPINDYWLGLALSQTDGGFMQDIGTDTNGNFKLYVPAGTYQITSWNYTLPADETSSFTVDAGASTTKTIQIPVEMVTGTVTDASSNAASGASVELSGSNWQYFDYSDGNGAITDYVEPGTYTVKAISADGTAMGTTTVDVGKSGPASFSVSLSQAVGSVTGYVYDANGNAVQTDVQLQDGNSKVIDDAYTNQDGSYTLYAPTGDYNIVINNGPSPVSVPVSITAGQSTSVNINATTTGIAGVATLASGAFAAGAQVQLYGQWGNLYATTTAGPDGSFNFSIFPGTYTVKAADGYDTGSANDITVSQGQVAPANITLSQESGIISGDVLDATTGQPLTGYANIQVFDQNHNPIANAWANPDGSFSVNVPTGTYQVSAMRDWLMSPPVTVMVQNNSTSVANVQMPSSGLQGVVKDVYGAPVPNASVTIAAPGNTQGSVTLYTDPSGSYTWYAQPGTYTVTAQDGYQMGQDESVNVGSSGLTSADVTLNETAGAISGQVTNGSTGSPISAYVQVFKGTQEVGSTWSDPNGNYTIYEPPGDYTVQATMYQGSDDSSAPQPVTVTANQTASANLSVTVTGVQLTVENADGSTAAGASTVITDVYGNEIYNAPSVPSGGIIPLSPGTYTISATQGYYTGEASNVVVSSGETQPVTVSLTQEDGAVSGTVSLSASSVASGVQVLAMDGDGNVVASAMTANDGSYTLLLPQGTYTIEVNDGAESASLANVNVTAGQTVNGDMTLALSSLSGVVTDGSGNLLSGADVKVISANWGAPGGITVGPETVGEATTGSDGSFQFDLPTGTYTVIAEENGQIATSFVTIGGGSATTNLSLANEAATVTGQVYLPANIFTGIQVSVIDANGNIINTTQTETNIPFSLDVPAGSYTVVASTPDGTTSASSTVTVSAGESKSVGIPLTMTGVTGSITDKATGYPFMTSVVALDPTTQQPVAFGSESPSGQYFIPIAAGTYDIRVQGFDGNGMQTFATQSVTVTDGQTATQDFAVDVPGISGKITNALTGAPVGEVGVRITGANSFVTGGMVGPDGTFTIPLPAGTYTATFTDFGTDETIATLNSISVGTGTTVENVTASNLAMISGHVTNADGSPAAGITVNIGDSNGNMGWVTTGPDGGYTEILPDGTYDVYVGSGSTAAVATNVQVSGTDTTKTDLVLSPASVVQGNVVDSSGAPEPYPYIQVFDTNNTLVTQDVKADGRGNFTLPLPDGTYTIDVSGTSSDGTLGSAAQTVTVANGTVNPSPLTFTLSSSGSSGSGGNGGGSTGGLTAPTGLTHSDPTADGWTESWSPVPNAVTYSVYVDGTLAASGITGTSYTITSEAPDTSYGVTVVAYDGNGNASSESAVDTVQTADPYLQKVVTQLTNLHDELAATGGLSAVQAAEAQARSTSVDWVSLVYGSTTPTDPQAAQVAQAVGDLLTLTYASAIADPTTLTTTLQQIESDLQLDTSITSEDLYNFLENFKKSLIEQLVTASAPLPSLTDMATTALKYAAVNTINPGGVAVFNGLLSSHGLSLSELPDIKDRIMQAFDPNGDAMNAIILAEASSKLVAPTPTSLADGDTATYELTVDSSTTGLPAITLSPSLVTWTSSDESVASFATDGSGTLTANKPGTTQISAAFDGHTIQQFTLTVPALPAVTGLTPGKLSTSGWTESWTTVEGAKSYDVYVDGATKPVNVTATSYDVGGTFKAGTQHTITVVPVDANGYEGASATDTVSTLLPAPVVSTQSATATDTTWTVSWSPVAGAKSYNVYLVNADGSLTPAGTVQSSQTSFTMTNQSSATTYLVEVKAVDAYGHESTPSQAVGVTTLLSAPTNLGNSSVSPSGFTESWDAVAGASGYNVYVTNDNTGTTKKLNISSASGTSIGITDLLPSTDYTVIVKAVDQVGNEGVPTTADKVRTAVGVPTGLTSSGVTDSGWTEQWSPVTNATGYNIYVNGQQIDSVAGSVYSYTFKNMDADTPYDVTVTAVDTTGAESAQSTIDTATTLVPTPTNVSHSDVLSSTWTESWDAVYGATKYDIYVGGKLSDSTTNTSYDFQHMTPQTKYDVTVVAVDENNGNQSAASAADTVTTPVGPVAPTGISHKNVTTLSWTETWKAVSGAESYNVYVNGDLVDNTTTPSYTFDNLEAGTTYTIGITTLMPDGEESTKTTDTVTTLSAPMTPGVNAVTTTDTAVTGTGTPGATITISADGKVIGTGTVAANGTYTVKISAQTAGTVLTVVSQDSAGNQSQPVQADVWTDGCFIATAAFGSKFEPNVALLRRFRDNYLLPNAAGRVFVRTYYKTSPPIARLIESSPVRRKVVRGMLAPVVAMVRMSTGLEVNRLEVKREEEQ